MIEDGFTPFVPPVIDPLAKFPPAPVHKKVPRKKRPPAADKPKTAKIPPNIFKKKRKNPPAERRGKPRVIGKRPELAAPYDKKQQRSQLSFSDMLTIAWQLKEGDGEIFEAVLETLRPLPKTARTRILAAVGRVFT